MIPRQCYICGRIVWPWQNGEWYWTLTWKKLWYHYPRCPK